MEPELYVECDISPDDPEVKRNVLMRQVIRAMRENSFNLDNRLLFTNRWHRALKAVALYLRYKQRLRNIATHEKRGTLQRREYQPLSVEELQAAEVSLIAVAQSQSFHEEITALQGNHRTHNETEILGNKGHVKLSNGIVKLDPFMDRDKLLRVGGRTKRANLSKEMTHQVILPRKAHTTELIVLHYHEKTHHVGRGITLPAIRAAGYWILEGLWRAAFSTAWHAVSCEDHLVHKRWLTFPATDWSRPLCSLFAQ